MSAPALIHEGIVERLLPGAGVARVRLIPPQDGCSGCAAEALCGSRRSESVNVLTGGRIVQPDQRVKVAVSTQRHRMAVWLMLIVPLLALIGGFFICRLLTESEGLCALVSIACMVLAFAGVWLTLPKKIKNISYYLID